MFLLRLLVVGLYPACFVALLVLRRRQAIAAARGAGAQVELELWARSPRRPRILAVVAAALLLTCLPRVGLALGFVFALVTAPLAASGAVRLLTITSSGLIVDALLSPWDEFSGWKIEAASGRLLVLRRDAGRQPIALELGAVGLRAAAAVLAPRLPEIVTS